MAARKHGRDNPTLTPVNRLDADALKLVADEGLVLRREFERRAYRMTVPKSKEAAMPDLSKFADNELFDELVRRSEDSTDEPELNCESIDARMRAAEREIAIVLRRHRINGVIGLCYGMHARGAVIQEDLHDDSKEALVRGLVVADQLNDMTKHLVEGSRVHLMQAYDKLKELGFDESDIEPEFYAQQQAMVCTDSSLHELDEDDGTAN